MRSQSLYSHSLTPSSLDPAEFRQLIFNVWGTLDTRYWKKWLSESLSSSGQKAQILDFSTDLCKFEAAAEWVTDTKDDWMKSIKREVT